MAHEGITIDRALMRARRRTLRLTQAALGQRVGVGQRWILAIERGESRPGLALAGALEDALGVRLAADEEVAS